MARKVFFHGLFCVAAIADFGSSRDRPDQPQGRLRFRSGVHCDGSGKPPHRKNETHDCEPPSRKALWVATRKTSSSLLFATTIRHQDPDYENCNAIASACVGHLERTDTDYYLRVLEKGQKTARKALLEAAPPVLAYLDAGGVDALYARLRRDGITHVAVISAPPPTEVASKIEERETALSPSAQRTLAQMLDRYAATVVQRGTAALFTLGERPSRPQ